MSDTPRTDRFSTTIEESYSNHCEAFKEMVHFSRALEKQLAEKDKDIERMRNLVVNFADVVQVNAFAMPAPNAYTPILVQLANTARNAAYLKQTDTGGAET